jgi:hypothetical protein
MAKKRRRPGPFAGPDESFPIGDKKHARLAIGGATRSYRAGNISESEEDSIKAKARKRLTASKGAKARTGKTKSWIGS